MSDRIISAPSNQAYRDGWERAFGKQIAQGRAGWVLIGVDSDGVRQYEANGQHLGVGPYRPNCGCIAVSRACDKCLPEPDSKEHEC